MSLLELARRRRTVREFKRDAFPMEKLIKCVEVAKEAPSGINKQPWHFVLVNDPSKKREIRNACEKKEKELHSRVRGELKE